MDKELLAGLVVEVGFLMLSLYMIRKFYFHPEEIQNDLENSLLGEWFDIKENREKNIKKFKRRGIIIMLMFLVVLVFFIRDLLRLFPQIG